MSETGFEPLAVAALIEAETARLLDTADAFTDADVRAPSPLPGWTRGHVLTHLARNADGGRRLLSWARTGVEAREYASPDARAAEIEAGASRGARELAADVRESAARFLAEYALMPDGGWERPVRWTAGQELPVRRAADARLTEVVVHHADLAAGYGPADWPPAFAADMLARLAPFAARARVRVAATGQDRAYDGAGPLVAGPAYALVAWLMGRTPGTGLTVTGGALPALPDLY